jgi:hypothetical protein
MNASSFIAALGWYRREIFDTYPRVYYHPYCGARGKTEG